MSTHAGGARRAAGQRLDTFYARNLRQTLQRVEASIRTRPTEAAYVYDRYGMQIGQYNGTSDATALPTADARAFAGGTVTHNHPAGGSFSAHDVAFAQQSRLAEMRAVGEMYCYSLRPPQGGWDHVDTTFIARPADYLEQMQTKWRSRLRSEVAAGRAMTQDEFNLEVSHRAMLDMARDTGITYRRMRWK